MRDAVTKDIDQHIKSIDEKIDVLNVNIEKLAGLESAQLFALLAGAYGTDMDMNFTIEWGENGHGKVLVAGNEVAAFKRGGLVDYTGPAWVDGSKRKPEAFLSAADTAMIQRLVDSLETGDGFLGSVVISNLQIHTEHLDNNQDFMNAGRIFASEFNKALQNRGIRPNVSKK
jgi:hypothetical protein